MSARAQDGIRRVARTLADLAGTDAISLGQVAEAISLRAERSMVAGAMARGRSGQPADTGQRTQGRQE